MIYEGVNFNVKVCSAMSGAEFEARHIGHVWQGRDVETRKKMLAAAYGMMKPTRPAKAKESAKED